jgi:hypothetical protein
MLKKIGDYIIPEWALPALINGDTSGLTGTEENNLECFINDLGDWENLVFVDKGEKFFSWRNDIDGLGAECFEVTIYGHPVQEGAHNEL